MGSEVTLHTETIASGTISKFAVIFANISISMGRLTTGSNNGINGSTIIKIKVNGVTKNTVTLGSASITRHDTGAFAGFVHSMVSAVDNSTDWSGNIDVIVTAETATIGNSGTITVTCNDVLILGGIE